jgi:cysteine desulfurase
MQNNKVYLDYAASTPVDRRVIDAMLPYFNIHYGNSSSIHRWGQQTEAALEQSRDVLASILGCKSQEIVFTSCGSESDNLALRGVALKAKQERGASHLLISPVEHHAVLHTAQDLANVYGFEVEYLPVTKDGIVEPSELEKRIRQDTALVSIIYANNEIGSINPLQELGMICKEHEIPFHTDAVQAASQLDINVDNIGVDLMSLGAHKFYGPKGVGALYVRMGTQLLPIQTGGSQEKGLRAGTPNVPLIVGMAKALEITRDELQTHNARYAQLRDAMLAAVPEMVPETKITGHITNRLPNLASFVFRNTDGNQLLTLLDSAGFGCSSGSACKTGDPAPSDVILAIGFEPDWALGSLRVSVGRPTSTEEIKAFIDMLPEKVAQVRRLRQ